MNNNGATDKLDWMYKSANSLVDREDYLLGRAVDKPLEQLNAEEKEKRLGLVPPKNHVEHECIPPSIRDFNKIVQEEQVDLSAKLQEDPLVAIKKREEEARRKFLQNPVQLKKLQEALKAQELKKKKEKYRKSHDDSDSDIDSKIVEKLKYLKNDPLGLSLKRNIKKKSEDSALDTILMHKFNELKDRLSQDDLNDILAGRVSGSDEESEREEKKYKRKKSSEDESDHKQSKFRRNEEKQKNKDKKLKRKVRKRSPSTSESDNKNSSEDEGYKRKRTSNCKKDEEKRKKYMEKSYYKNKRNKNLDRKYRHSDSENSSEEEDKETRYREKLSDKKKHTNILRKIDSKESHINEKREVVDPNLEARILEKLKILRESAKSKRSSDKDSDSERASNRSSEVRKPNKYSTDSNSSDGEQNPQYDSDGDEIKSKPRAFGLVKADGSKIALNKISHELKKSDKPRKVETVTKVERKNVKRLTEEEKEQIRREMMKNAEKRDKERSDNLKKYRDEDKREERNSSNFDKEFMHKQLLRTTKEATVESRIKSNLNNIQRSSRHMDSHFSRR